MTIDMLAKLFKVFKHTYLFAFFAHSGIATAEEFEDLIGSENSPTFTKAELKLITDATDRFKKYYIPDEVTGGEPFWIDNERLAFSSRKYPGWAAENNEPSRIISYNIKTGEVVDSGYRGILRCLNHLNDVLIHQMDQESRSFSSPEKYRWFAGKWGQPLEKIEYVPHTQIPTYLCRFVSNGPFIFGVPYHKLPPISSKLTPLLPEHGALRETISVKDGEVMESVSLIASDGKETWLKNKRLSHYQFSYQPWNESYFEAGAASNPPATIFPQGSIEMHPAPRVIRFWKITQGGSSAGFPSRAGVIWSVQQGYSFWRKQGVYIEKGNKLIRIEAGNNSSNPKTSPNGCMVYIGATPGDPYDLSQKNKLIIIDVCSEIKS